MYLHELFPRRFAVGGTVPQTVYQPYGGNPAQPSPTPATPAAPGAGTGFGVPYVGPHNPLPASDPSRIYSPTAASPGGQSGTIGAGTVDQHGGPFYQNSFNAVAPISKLNFTGANLDKSNYGSSISQAQQGYGSLLSMLQGQAAGTGPNPALDQLRQTTDRNIAQAHALASSNPNNAGALRNISRMASEANADASGQAATLRAQQQLGAQGLLANTLQGLYGTSAGAQNAQNQNITTNWLDPQRLALEQSQGNQTAFGNAQGLNAQTSAQNLTAAQQFQNQAAQAVAGGLNGLAAAGTQALGGKISSPTDGGYSGTTSDGQNVTVGDVNTSTPSYDGTTQAQNSYNFGDYFRGGAVRGYSSGGKVDRETLLDILSGGPDVGEPTGVSSYVPRYTWAAPGGSGGGDGGGGGSIGAPLALGLGLGKGIDIGTQILQGGKAAPPIPGSQPATIQVPSDPNGPLKGAPQMIPNPNWGPSDSGPGISYPINMPRSGAPQAGIGGGGSLAFSGGPIGGHAAYGGDNPRNDTVPAMLSPGEIVLPRSVTQDDHAAEKAAAFVEAIKRRKMGKAA